MSIFKFPKSTCDNINSLLAKYWWGQTKEERKIHWINWKKLCTQKKEGGMGFRDLHSFNLAMLSKQAWRLIHDTNSLFYKVYKAQYFPNSSFMMENRGRRFYQYHLTICNPKTHLYGLKTQPKNSR